MKITDAIAQAILELLDEDNGTAQIRRNELATKIGCVPSQINYVITSRFTPEQGYIVESRRGGGGFIRIQRAQMTASGYYMHIVNSVGSRIDENSVRAILENLFHQKLLDQKQALLIRAATADAAFKAVDPAKRDEIRAEIFKQMLVTLA